MLTNEVSVYILIPIHNRRQTTERCLRRLAEVNLLQSPYTVVVVDDGSTDGSAEMIRRQFADVVLLSGDGELWWTGAMRLGMAYAKQHGADYIVWLNDDCLVSVAAVAGLVTMCQENSAAIAGCQGYVEAQPSTLAFGGKRQTWKGFRYQSLAVGEQQPCDLLSGNLVCLPTQVIDQVGYPDVKRTPHYGGDALYLLRARKAGYQLYIDARYPVYDSSVGESRLYPADWLLAEGSPTHLLSLVFMPQSGLSWRVWFATNWEAYGLWGMVMFAKKYATILALTLLRYLPLSLRQSVVAR
ncbi:MAG: glycosyltransferase family 2 protein [Cyanobacteria bacterium J06633_23]